MTHPHDFLGDTHVRNARRTWAVLILCAAMMAVEIVAGILFGSMALLADGFHMATRGGEVRDLHLWRLGPGHHGLIPSVADGLGRPTAHYRALLADVPGLSHVTIELASPE